MEKTRLAILGVGSLRCTVPVIGTLSCYFGERPLDICLYDADEERLDLFDAFARAAFAANENLHSVRATSDAREALEEVDRVILQVNDNCAVKEARLKRAPRVDAPFKRISATLARVLAGLESNALVLSLQSREVVVPLDHYYRLDWPKEIGPDERRALPHQVLRWIRSEEPMFELFKEFQKSPLKAWLDDPSLATIVSEH